MVAKQPAKNALPDALLGAVRDVTTPMDAFDDARGPLAVYPRPMLRKKIAAHDDLPRRARSGASGWYLADRQWLRQFRASSHVSDQRFLEAGVVTKGGG